MLNTIKLSVPMQAHGQSRLETEVLRDLVGKIPVSARARYDLRVVTINNQQFLAAKKLSTFGSFKELTGWDAKRRDQERQLAGTVFATAAILKNRTLSQTPTSATAEEVAIYFDLGSDDSRTSGAGGVSNSIATEGVEGPGIPVNASPKQITQLPGTVTCWALSTLHSIMSAPDGQAFLNERFTKDADGYHLKLADGRIVTVTDADLADVNKQRKETNPSRTVDDTRPGWVRAFECAATRIDERSYRNATISDELKSAASGVFLAKRLGLNTSGNSGHGSPTADIVNGYDSRKTDTSRGKMIGAIALRRDHFVSVSEVDKEKGTIKFVNGLGGQASSGPRSSQPGQVEEQWAVEKDSGRQAEMTYFYLPTGR